MSRTTNIRSTGWSHVTETTQDLVGKFSWVTDERRETAQKYKGNILRIEDDSVVIFGAIAEAVDAEKKELSFPVGDAQVEIMVLSSDS